MNINILLTAASALAMAPVASSVAAETSDDTSLTIMLTGASFAVEENGWFEIGCAELGATPINKAVAAQAITNTANSMYSGTFYTTAELDETDVLVIDHAHNQNVANTEWLKDDYNDYTMPTTNYAIAYDYVIKRYTADCYNLKDNPDSKYYGTETGKPVKIVLCTHWHDSRTTFNPAIRTLAEKWGLPLVKFDDNIGFTKDELVDGQQPSLLYAKDTETISGVKYGWHPKRGKAEYIQQKMAQIFVAEMADFLGLDIPFLAELQQKDFAVAATDTPMAKCSFSGATYPMTVCYSVGGESFTVEDVEENPLLITLPESAAGKTVELVSVTDANGNQAALSGEVTVAEATKSVAPTADVFIHENYKDKSYTTDETLSLKTGENWGRQIYLTFKTDEVASDDLLHTVRLYLKETNKMTTETIQIEGNTQSYATPPTWNTRNRYAFEEIASVEMTPSEAGSYISWDVTDWLKQKKQEGAENVTFRVAITSSGASLLTFHATESTTAPELAPELLIVEKSDESGVGILPESAVRPYPTTFTNSLSFGDGTRATVYYLDGSLVYDGAGASIDTGGWRKGLYIAKIGCNIAKLIKR